MTTFELADYDKNTALWIKLKAHLEYRLADARRRNDAVLPEPETAALRGEIRCLKRIIALGADRPEMTGNTEAPDGPSMMELFNATR